MKYKIGDIVEIRRIRYLEKYNKERGIIIQILDNPALNFYYVVFLEKHLKELNVIQCEIRHIKGFE